MLASLLPLIGAGCAASSTTDTAVTTDTDTTTATDTATSDTSGDTASYVYADGTYTAEGDYQSPGGAESIGVTLVIKNDVITDATVENHATLPISMSMQTVFAENYKAQVVGKKLDDVNLTKVSGSSLTPKGFNNAVAKIKAEAAL